MASPAEIAELRAMVNEPTNAAPYTDQALSDRIDAATSLNSVAAAIWREKAATYSGLVDVQEGSSRRSLGSLYANALKMASSFEAEDSDTGPGSGGFVKARTRQIERG